MKNGTSKKNNKKVFSGVSLIELLVVIAITLMLLTVGIANYRGVSQQKSITYYQDLIRSDLRLTQSLALTGYKPQACISTNHYLTEFVFKRTAARQYKIIANCDSYMVDYKTVNLPTAFQIFDTGTTIPHEIHFLVVGKGTDLTTNARIELRYVSSSYYIYVTPSGQIY